MPRSSNWASAVRLVTRRDGHHRVATDQRRSGVTVVVACGSDDDRSAGTRIVERQPETVVADAGRGDDRRIGVGHAGTVKDRAYDQPARWADSGRCALPPRCQHPRDHRGVSGCRAGGFALGPESAKIEMGGHRPVENPDHDRRVPAALAHRAVQPRQSQRQTCTRDHRPPRFANPRGCVNLMAYLRLAHVRVGLRKRLQRANIVAVTVIEVPLEVMLSQWFGGTVTIPCKARSRH